MSETRPWTEQQAEAFTRLMLAENRQYGVIFFDTELRFTGWNEGARFITGWTAEEIIGQPTSITFVPEDRDRKMDVHEAVVASAVEAAEDERWHLRKDGSRFWSSGVSVPFRRDGTVVGYMKVFRDATHMRARSKYLENELHESNARHRQRDTFVGTIAHELRNPLSPLKMSVEMLRRSPCADTHVDLIRVMDRQLGFLERLVEDLVDLTRVQAGKLSIDYETAPLQRLLLQAIESVREQAQAKRLTLSPVLPTVAIEVEVDTQRIQQVLVNLLNNAIKYTPPGGGVWLSATADQTHWMAHVKDNGQGISPDLLPRIFDAFTQAEGADTHRGHGLGIGLSLVKEIVSLHQGTVEVRSEGPGRGSEFIVRVPLRQPRGSATEPGFESSQSG